MSTPQHLTPAMRVKIYTRLPVFPTFLLTAVNHQSPLSAQIIFLKPSLSFTFVYFCLLLFTASPQPPRPSREVGTWKLNACSAPQSKKLVLFRRLLNALNVLKMHLKICVICAICGKPSPACPGKESTARSTCPGEECAAD